MSKSQNCYQDWKKLKIMHTNLVLIANMILKLMMIIKNWLQDYQETEIVVKMQ